MLALEDIMDFHQLKQQGMSLRAISRHTGHHRQTIVKYLRQGLKEPRYKPREPGPGKLDPYREYLGNRMIGFQKILRQCRQLGKGITQYFRYLQIDRTLGKIIFSLYLSYHREFSFIWSKIMFAVFPILPRKYMILNAFAPWERKTNKIQMEDERIKPEKVKPNSGCFIAKYTTIAKTHPS